MSHTAKIYDALVSYEDRAAVAARAIAIFSEALGGMREALARIAEAGRQIMQMVAGGIRQWVKAIGDWWHNLPRAYRRAYAIPSYREVRRRRRVMAALNRVAAPT